MPTSIVAEKKPDNYRVNRFYLMNRHLSIAGMARPDYFSGGTAIGEKLNYLNHTEKRMVLIGLFHASFAAQAVVSGLEYIHIPVADFQPVPPETYDQLYAAIKKATQEGKTVTVHCGAGDGRTGTALSALKLRELLEKQALNDINSLDESPAHSAFARVSYHGVKNVPCTPLVKEAIDLVRTDRLSLDKNGEHSVETETDVKTLLTYEKHLRAMIKKEFLERVKAYDGAWDRLDQVALQFVVQDLSRRDEQEALQDEIEHIHALEIQALQQAVNDLALLDTANQAKSSVEKLLLDELQQHINEIHHMAEDDYVTQHNVNKQYRSMLRNLVVVLNEARSQFIKDHDVNRFEKKINQAVLSIKQITTPPKGDIWNAVKLLLNSILAVVAKIVFYFFTKQQTYLSLVNQASHALSTNNVDQKTKKTLQDLSTKINHNVQKNKINSTKYSKINQAFFMGTVEPPKHYREATYSLLGQSVNVIGLADLNYFGQDVKKTLIYLKKQGVSKVFGLQAEPVYSTLARHFGVDYVDATIPDFTAPDIALYDQVYDEIERQATVGKKVAIHCHGGMGRTGTVLAALKIREMMQKNPLFLLPMEETYIVGADLDTNCSKIVYDAVAYVRSLPGSDLAIESIGQLESLCAYERHLRIQMNQSNAFSV